MKALKWWLALVLVFVFFAGAATGLFAGAWHARRVFIIRHGEHFHDRMRDHLKRELALTAEQNEKIAPILDRLSNRLEEIRTETDARVAEAMTQSHDEVVPFLTPEQREKMEMMRERHHRMMRMRGKHRPAGPSPSPVP